MFLADYHIHSKYSFDGKEEIGDLAEKAKACGMAEIAITDHVEFAADMKEDWGKLEREAADTIDQVSCAGLRVLKGMELGNANLELQKANERAEAFRGDFILGSVHNIKPLEDVLYYDYAKMDCDSFYLQYLDEVLKLITYSDFDVLGHITYPFKGIYAHTKRVPDFSLYEEKMREIFLTLVRRGKGIEVNTSGLRAEYQELLPDRKILRLYRECGGRILTLGSDSHVKEDVGSGIAYAAQTVSELGFEQITVFRNRKPVFVNIYEDAKEWEQDDK